MKLKYTSIKKTTEKSTLFTFEDSKIMVNGKGLNTEIWIPNNQIRYLKKDKRTFYLNPWYYNVKILKHQIKGHGLYSDVPFHNVVHHFLS